MTSGLISRLPGGKLKPPEWSSPEGSDASRLLEQELTTRFIGGTFASATPIADVRRAHLPMLGQHLVVVVVVVVVVVIIAGSMVRCGSCTGGQRGQSWMRIPPSSIPEHCRCS